MGFSYMFLIGILVNLGGLYLHIYLFQEVNLPNSVSPFWQQCARLTFSQTHRVDRKDFGGLETSLATYVKITWKNYSLPCVNFDLAFRNAKLA